MLPCCNPNTKFACSCRHQVQFATIQGLPNCFHMGSCLLATTGNEVLMHL